MGNCLGNSPSSSENSATKAQLNISGATTQPKSRNVYVSDQQDRIPPPPSKEAPPTPPFPNPTATLVVGIYSYHARTDDDLSFNKGNHFHIRHSRDYFHAQSLVIKELILESNADEMKWHSY